MVNKGDIKVLGLVVAGVLIAGFGMSYFRDIEVVRTAANGYGN